MGVCSGVSFVESSHIRACKEISTSSTTTTTNPVASGFWRFTPTLGPLLRFVRDVFPRGITVAVGFGVCQSFPFAVEPLRDAGRVPIAAPVR